MRNRIVSIFVAILIVACQTHKEPTVIPPVLTLGAMGFSLEEMRSRLTEKEIEINNTYDGSKETLKGFTLTQILDEFTGINWRTNDGILFTALDGYKVDVPVSKILKFDPLITFSYKDGARAFKVDKKDGKDLADLGPFYLVWDNLRHPELLKEGNDDWPFQIAKVEPISYSIFYSNVFPFSKTSNLKEGFEFYKRNCMTCHALNGQGGTKGPELWPYPRLAKMNRKKFLTWVLNPEQVAPGTTMPAMFPEASLEDRKSSASKIYDYLIALNKKSPAKAKN